MAKPKDGVVDRLRRNLGQMLDPEIATAKPQRAAAAPRAPAPRAPSPSSSPAAAGTERDFGDRIKIRPSQMNRLARAIADKVGVPSYLHGAHSLSLVTAALGAGFAYIDGDAVAKLIDHPRGLVDFRLADLYRPLTGS